MHSGDASRPLKILVAAPTFKRNDLLDGLLASLNRLTLPEDASVSFAIIDNDRTGGAKPVVEKWQAAFQAPLSYLIEPAPGVTHVRNRALDLAAEADLLAFIDDDEHAGPNWLFELVRRYRDTRAAAVFGPVEPVYPETAPQWMRDWAIHGTPIADDEDQGKPGATCNCLIDMHVVRAEGLRFDARMSLTGAEDTLFFTHLLDRGHRLTRAKGAQVFEHVPENRARIDWLLRRWYRTGLTDALIAGRNMSPLKARFRGGVHGVLRVVTGALMVAAAFIFTLGQGRRLIMSRAYTLARGLGMISFAFGARYEEYGRAKTAP